MVIMQTYGKCSLVSAQADDLWLAFRVRSFVRAFVRS